MIHYQPITIESKALYEAVLHSAGERGCEYSFANLYLWGRQRMAFVEEGITVFSQFDRRSVYLFPIGNGLESILERIIHDAGVRDIPCRLTGLTKADCALVEALYPGKFRFHTDRNSFDYLYDIHDLANLTGKKFQRKRNHINRFLQQYPNTVTEPIQDENTPEVLEMVEQWYAQRLQVDPTGDYHMERAALMKALQHRKELEMEGILLRVNGAVAAMTLGSRMTRDTFDIHFEKALDCFDGAYATINREFARYLREKFPEVTRLDREEDMGIEGLRKAKLSYHPIELREKYWACLLEDGYDY